MRISLKFLGDAFTILVLFLGTGAFISLMMDSSNPDATTDGSLLTQFGWSLIYIVVLVRAVPLRREILQVLKANKLLIVLVFIGFEYLQNFPAQGDGSHQHYDVNQGPAKLREQAAVGGSVWIGTVHHQGDERTRPQE